MISLPNKNKINKINTLNMTKSVVQNSLCFNGAIKIGNQPVGIRVISPLEFGLKRIFPIPISHHKENIIKKINNDIYI